MQISTLFKILDFVTLVASLLTAVRAVRSGMARRYPWLTGFLIFMTPYLAGPMLLNLRSVGYFWFWVGTTPVCWMLELLLVRELCGAVLAKYRGICSLGRWMMYGAVAISACFSLASLTVRIGSPISLRSKMLVAASAAERGVHLGLTIFLLLMLFLVSRYPVRLCRNVMLNTVVFALFFLSNTLAATLRAVFDLKLGMTVDTYLAGLSCVCAVAWLLFLTPAGEDAPCEWKEFSPDYERRVLGRLELLNRTILGTPV